MSLISKEALYHLSPVWLQNKFISLYGKKLYKLRYAPPFDELLSHIKAIESKNSQSVQNEQLLRLKKILTHAEAYVPYYRDLFKSIGFNAQDLKSIKDLELIPPLEKETLRENPELFHSTHAEDQVYFLQKTSGSTGKPLQIEVDERTYKNAMALLVAHEEQHGVAFGEPRATFAGRMIQSIDDMTPPFSRYNKAENQMIFSSYHLNEETIEEYVRELSEFKPVELIGYPSAIYLLAFLIKKMNIALSFQPKVVVTNSETLLGWQKQVIEDVFNVAVRDYYGTAEYVVFANQCNFENYHINPALGLLEVVNEESTSVVDEEGDILCTTLSNKVMPLIRYRVGDRAIKAAQPCGCGQHTDILSKVIGRIDDYILTKDKRKIGRMDHIFKGLDGIKESQLIQVQNDLCLLKIVKSKQNSQIDTNTLMANFKERVGEGIKLDLLYVDVIEKNKNGKFKSVVGLKK